MKLELGDKGLAVSGYPRIHGAMVEIVGVDEFDDTLPYRVKVISGNHRLYGEVHWVNDVEEVYENARGKLMIRRRKKKSKVKV
jgi:hypothetical protein